MIIDFVILFIYRYGLYILFVEALCKLLVLLAYKPNKPSYAFINFFRVYRKFDIRDDKKEKWDDFLKKNKPLTIAFYVSLGIWLFTFGVMFFFSKT